MNESTKILGASQSVLETATSGARCANCRFYIASPVDGQPSYCRRYPPTAFIVQVYRDDKTKAITGNEQMSIMPITNEANWCGEYQAKLN